MMSNAAELTAKKSQLGKKAKRKANDLMLGDQILIMYCNKK